MTAGFLFHSINPQSHINHAINFVISLLAGRLRPTVACEHRALCRLEERVQTTAMDFPWPSGGVPAPDENELNLLASCDDFLNIDDQTLSVGTNFQSSIIIFLNVFSHFYCTN